MRTMSTRERAAASLFAVFGLTTLAMALATTSLVLATVAVVAFVAAAAALRNFPTDRNW
jgi:hypothetical protein